MISHLDSSRPQKLHRPLRRGTPHPNHDGWGAPASARRPDERPCHPGYSGPASSQLTSDLENVVTEIAALEQRGGLRFHLTYIIQGVCKLLVRGGWSCQVPARRAIERDDEAVAGWVKEVWPRAEDSRR
ncbi:winged helix-turn-helix domain-containing protein [Streptomyces sp. NPDC001893]|uniref:helix-turn-helix domain-containing protein n=1 Tax=Streptomyces sp. NPDC001893 TaxID=3154530 RepID=UPI003331F9B3